MAKGFLRCVCLAGLTALGVLASAQGNFKFDYIGIEAGSYFPSSGLLKDRFGDTIFRVGITPMMIKRQKDWVPSFEVGFMGASGHGDRFSVFPLTVGVQKSFGDPDTSTVPFIRAAAGFAYFDFDITKDNLENVSERKFGGVTALEAGFISGDRFRASVRYYLMQKQEGIDFSGVLISVSYGAFKI